MERSPKPNTNTDPVGIPVDIGANHPIVEGVVAPILSPNRIASDIPLGPQAIQRRMMMGRIARHGADTSLPESLRIDRPMQHAAEDSISRLLPSSDNDTLAYLSRSYKTPRSGFPERPSTSSHTLSPHSRLHDGAAIRSGLRADAILANGKKEDKYTTLYGNMLYSKGQQELELKNGHYKHSQKSAIRKAGRIVRKAQRSSNRIATRLEVSAKGYDNPTLLYAARHGVATAIAKPIKAAWHPFSRRTREEKRADSMHAYNVAHNRAGNGPQDIHGFSWENGDFDFEVERDNDGNLQVVKKDRGGVVSRTIVDPTTIDKQIRKLGGSI